MKNKIKENFVFSEKFFFGKVVWGFGGYVKDCVFFGFVDFSNKLDLLLCSIGLEYVVGNMCFEVRVL